MELNLKLNYNQMIELLELYHDELNHDFYTKIYFIFIKRFILYIILLVIVESFDQFQFEIVSP